MECRARPLPSCQRSTAPPRPPPPELMASNHRSEATALSLSDFHQQHDEAFKAVEKGLAADEEGDLDLAKECYSQSLMLLDKGLGIDCEQLVNATQEQRDAAKQMQLKMNKSRLQIAYRLDAIQGDNRHSAITELVAQSQEMSVRLPSYEEAVLSSPSSETALGESILADEREAQERASANATQLFTIADGVQIFFITGQGYVSAPSYPSSLHVVKLEEPAETQNTPTATNSPPAFLQVGDWFYPLLPGASPILHTTYGAYIFPDLTSEEAGSSVGLMLPDSVTDAEKHCLEDILKNFAAIQNQLASIQPQDLVLPSAPAEDASGVSRDEHQHLSKEAGQQSTSSKLSRGIIIASEWISWGLGKGAEKAGELISMGSQRVRQKLQPVGQPSPVDDRVQKGIHYARKASHAAVRVSGFIVSQLGKTTVALAKKLAPHIREQGEKILPKSMKTTEAQSKVSGVLEVAASGLQGFGTVYISLEQAAKALARSLANETVNIVHHRYGPQAGRLTENTLYTAGNVAMTVHNADQLALKAVAKRAARETGRAVICNTGHEQASQEVISKSAPDRK